MGAYLSQPVVDKEMFEGEGGGLRYGGSAMQGWRRTMEDAHLAELEVANDPNVCIFGVFDGHGGAEVAKFCQKYMVAQIQQLEEFGRGSVEESLEKAFHRIVSASLSATAMAMRVMASTGSMRGCQVGHRGAVGARGARPCVPAGAAFGVVAFRDCRLVHPLYFRKAAGTNQGASFALHACMRLPGSGSAFARCSDLRSLTHTTSRCAALCVGGAACRRLRMSRCADRPAHLACYSHAACVLCAWVPALQDEMLRDGKYAEELEQLKTKEANEDDNEGEEGEGGGGGVSTMDALDLLKRVFQLKRFMGDGSSGNGEAKMDAESSPDPEETLVQAGCTAVVAVKFGNDLYVANAGDSRGVLSRSGKAIALSEDHKPAQEGERTRIIAAGGFLSEIGGVCRVNGNLNLSRAIGDLKYKCNTELPPKDQIITAQPEIRKIALTPEDRFFILACDGVWDVMSNQDAVDFVGARMDQGMTPSQVSSALLDACLANDPKEARGVGCDNMTCVVVQLNSAPKP